MKMYMQFESKDESLLRELGKRIKNLVRFQPSLRNVDCDFPLVILCENGDDLPDFELPF